MPTEIGSVTFYTVEELAAKFNASPATIYGYIRTGALAAKRFGKQYQIAESQVVKLLIGDSHAESH